MELSASFRPDRSSFAHVLMADPGIVQKDEIAVIRPTC
jgi:hypothetical protein